MAYQERAERTRAVILDAAAHAFDEQGFAGATLSTILERAQVTKGALYFHFRSKEEIAHAIINEQFAVEEDSDVSSGLQALINLTHELANRLQSDVRVRASIRLVIEHGTFTDPAGYAYKAWIQTTERLLAIAEDQGELRGEIPVHDIAVYLIGAFTGVQVSSEVLAGRADLLGRITTMWRIVLPGIAAPRRLAEFHPEGVAGPG